MDFQEHKHFCEPPLTTMERERIISFVCLKSNKNIRAGTMKSDIQREKKRGSMQRDGWRVWKAEWVGKKRWNYLFTYTYNEKWRMSANKHLLNSNRLTVTNDPHFSIVFACRDEYDSHKPNKQGTKRREKKNEPLGNTQSNTIYALIYMHIRHRLTKLKSRRCE